MYVLCLILGKPLLFFCLYREYFKCDGDLDDHWFILITASSLDILLIGHPLKQAFLAIE
jgi:hypothetical protein